MTHVYDIAAAVPSAVTCIRLRETNMKSDNRAFSLTVETGSRALRRCLHWYEVSV